MVHGVPGRSLPHGSSLIFLHTFGRDFLMELIRLVLTSIHGFSEAANWITNCRGRKVA